MFKESGFQDPNSDPTSITPCDFEQSISHPRLHFFRLEGE